MEMVNPDIAVLTKRIYEAANYKQKYTNVKELYTKFQKYAEQNHPGIVADWKEFMKMSKMIEVGGI